MAPLDGLMEPVMQSDVFASFAVDTGIGYYMHWRFSSISVGLLPMD